MSVAARVSAPVRSTSLESAGGGNTSGWLGIRDGSVRGGSATRLNHQPMCSSFPPFVQSIKTILRIMERGGIDLSQVLRFLFAKMSAITDEPPALTRPRRRMRNRDRQDRLLASSRRCQLQPLRRFCRSVTPGRQGESGSSVPQA